LLAHAMQRWNLHRRIALHILLLTGNRPATEVGGIMLASAFLSMWISNTATAMMMMPIAASLAALTDLRADASRFGVVLMLGTAYAASIGGLASLVGSPPNALLAAFMAQTYGFEIGFAHWMLIGLPIAMLMLPLTWLVLTRVMFRLPSDHGAEGGLAIIEAMVGRRPSSQTGLHLILLLFARSASNLVMRRADGSTIGPRIRISPSGEENGPWQGSDVLPRFSPMSCHALESRFHPWPHSQSLFNLDRHLNRRSIFKQQPATVLSEWGSFAQAEVNQATASTAERVFPDNAVDSPLSVSLLCSISSS